MEARISEAEIKVGIAQMERNMKEDKAEVTKNKVIAEKSVQVTNEDQLIDWEGCGIRLIIPKTNCQKIAVSSNSSKITVSRATDHLRVAFLPVQSTHSATRCVSQQHLKCSTVFLTLYFALYSLTKCLRQ